jgi:hypothetical protein
MSAVKGILTAVALLVGLSACGDDGAAELPTPVVQQPETRSAADDPDRLYDDEGNLLESDEVVVGLRLPRGLEEVARRDRLYAYTSSVPLDKLIAYFGPRLITGVIDRHGSTAIFREARPRDARGGVIPLDVAIMPMDRTRTRIEIREIPPPPAQLPSEDEVIREGREQSRRLD